jgi:hypothetical protein
LKNHIYQTDTRKTHFWTSTKSRLGKQMSIWTYCVQEALQLSGLAVERQLSEMSKLRRWTTKRMMMKTSLPTLTLRIGPAIVAMIATTMAMTTRAEEEAQLDIKKIMVRGILHQGNLATGEEKGIRTGTGETTGLLAVSDLRFLVRVEGQLALLRRRLRRMKWPTMIQTLKPRL